MDEQERGERDGRVGAARDFTQGSVYQDAYKRGEAQRAYWQMAGDGLAATLNNLRNAPPATQGLLAGLALMAVVIHWVGARLFFTVFAALFACLPILLGAVVRSEMKNLTLGESLLGLVLKPVASRRSRAYVGVSVVFGVAFVALVNGMFDPEREARIAARRAAQAPSWPREADEGYIRVTLPANGSPALPTANVMTKERQPAEANPAPPTSAVRVGSPREPQALRAGPCRVEGHGILRWIESAHAEVVVGTTTTSVFACNPAEGIKWTHPLESHGIVQEVRALSDGGAIIAGITGNSCHLARLSSDGSELWAAEFGAGAQSRCVPTSVAVGGVGPLYVAGTGAQFEGQEAATLGKPFVAAIDSKGGLVWHTAVRPQLGDAWTLTASHASNPLVAPDGQGGAYVAFGTPRPRCSGRHC